MGSVDRGVWKLYVSVGVRKRIDLEWMSCDAIKGPCSLDICRLGTGLSVGIAGEECMYWIVSWYFSYAVAGIP